MRSHSRSLSQFERHPARYDSWFDRHEGLYGAELGALRRLVRRCDRALEIGVGTGRFAGPLGIRLGIDPALPMLQRARERGVQPVGAVAEALPFGDHAFDLVLFVTTVCFVDDPERSFREAHRVLRPLGSIVVAFIDRTSELGARYARRSGSGSFYRGAHFYSPAEMETALTAGGFVPEEWWQVVVPADPRDDGARYREGYGEGAFVAVRASRASDSAAVER